MSPLDRLVRRAQLRLLSQELFNQLTLGLTVAWLLGLGWLLIQPWTPITRNSHTVFLLSLTLVGFSLSLVRFFLRATTRETAALELDARYGLRERVITAVSLDPDLRGSPVGQAVLADAESATATLSLRDHFAVRPRRLAWILPVLLIALGLTITYYHPQVHADQSDPSAPATSLAQANPNPQVPLVPKTNPLAPPRTPQGEERKDKSPTLKELENELTKLGDKYAQDPYADTPEKARELVTDLLPLEERLSKYAEEQRQQLEQLRSKLEQLDELSKKDKSQGPADGLNDALAQGDLDKAQSEVDELQKKIKNKDLSPDETQKLERQLDKLQDNLERLARNRDREEELEKKISEAKKQGEDAESLERELEQTRQENKESGEQLDRLADQIGKSKEALARGDQEQAATELQKVRDEIGKIQQKDQDFKDTQAALERAREQKRAACEACEKGKPGSSSQASGTKKPSQNQQASQGRGNGPSGPNQGGIGSGERDINKNAKVGDTVEERQRGVFDEKGKKNFGGLVKGQAFMKKSAIELGDEIRQSAQTAASAPDAQRLPREARDSVKEYFERLGQSTKKAP